MPDPEFGSRCGNLLFALCVAAWFAVAHAWKVNFWLALIPALVIAGYFFIFRRQ